MSPLKSFAVRSSATRAAKQAGYTLDQIGIGETNGRFYWFVKEATEVSEESTEADIGYGDKLEEDERMEPDSTDIQIAQVEAAVALGKKKATTTKAGAKKEHSTAERPCKKVWFIADDMITANPEVKRKEILEACAKAGIAFYTARTQYQQWLGVRKEMAEREAAAAAK